MPGDEKFYPNRDGKSCPVVQYFTDNLVSPCLRSWQPLKFPITRYILHTNSCIEQTRTPTLFARSFPPANAGERSEPLSQKQQNGKWINLHDQLPIFHVGQSPARTCIHSNLCHVIHYPCHPIFISYAHTFCPAKPLLSLIKLTLCFTVSPFPPHLIFYAGLYAAPMTCFPFPPFFPPQS